MRAVAFDGTGRFLATGDDTAEAVVWDVAPPAGRCVHPPGLGLRRRTESDGGLLATGCRDKHLRVFSLA